jgi:hypothetical protein
MAVGGSKRLHRIGILRVPQLRGAKNPQFMLLARSFMLLKRSFMLLFRQQRGGFLDVLNELS